MSSIAKVHSLIDTNVSETLQEKVRAIDAKMGTLSHQARYLEFESVLSAYQEEKGKLKGVQAIQILAVLFTALTQRKRNDGEPFWGPHQFNYHLLIGRKEEAVARQAWFLIDQEGMAPSTVQTSIMRHVSDVVRYRKVDPREAFRTVVQLLKEFGTGEGLGGGWSPAVQNQIRAEFQLPPLPQPGARKRRAAAEDKHVVEWAPVEGAPTEGESEQPAAEEPVTRKSVRTQRQAAQPRVLSEEECLTRDIREKFGQLMDLRLMQVPEEERAHVRASVRNYIRETFEYLRQTCERRARNHAIWEGLGDVQRRANERKEYEEACRFFVGSPPKNKLIGPGKFKAAKAIWRQKSKDLHPDHNPDTNTLNDFRKTQRYWTIIQDYHEKFKEESQEKPQDT
jgi:hypothetical protein